MRQVERIYYNKKEHKVLDVLCFYSKNLYNLANYYVRQEFINNKKYLNYSNLYPKLKDTEDFRKLPAQTSQQVLKILDKNWKSFFKSIKDWKINKQKYKSKPNLPGYLHKSKGRFIVKYPFQNLSLKKDSTIKLPKTNFRFKTTIQKSIKEVRLVPKTNSIILEVVYDKPIIDLNLDKSNIIGIDLGLNNLATFGSNSDQIKPYILNGRIIKSINQYYNKKKAELQSFINNKGTSNRILKLTDKRNRKIHDQLHKISRFVIDFCIQNNVGTIIIGKNDDWKQNINLGRKNNQNFVQIPFDTLIRQIQYKAELVGIHVEITEESYTSKCSFLDNEPVQKHEVYKGRRVKRGLFKSSRGTLINADLNAAYNMIRKVFLEAFKVDKIEGVVLHPVRLNIV